jgi:hypothetical protein
MPSRPALYSQTVIVLPFTYKNGLTQANLSETRKLYPSEPTDQLSLLQGNASFSTLQTLPFTTINKILALLARCLSSEWGVKKLSAYEAA